MVFVRFADLCSRAILQPISARWDRKFQECPDAGLESAYTENMDVERIINSVVARFIGTKHERDVKSVQPWWSPPSTRSNRR